VIANSVCVETFVRSLLPIHSYIDDEFLN